MMVIVGCAGDPDNVQVDLAPALISSLDGVTTVNAIVLAGSTPLEDEAVRITIDYKDRNGTDHPIAPIDAKTDSRGVVSQPLTGLTWDGIGTVTVTTGNMIVGTATFTVLDRTPPTVEILPPTTDMKVGPGLPIDVQVKVTDEIGISSVVLDATGGAQTTRQTLVASGTQMATLTFRVTVPQNPQGNTIELHALASDLSGNFGVAPAMTLTIDPTITIATPPGLSGALLTDGTTSQIVNPTAIAMSPKDNQLYVADVANVTGCTPSCVWKVDPASGSVAGKAVTGQGQIEGVAFDATGDNMYISDAQSRITRYTWDAGTMTYTNAAQCIDQQNPQNPYHLVFDGTRILVTDGQNKNLQTVAATCGGTGTGVALSAQNSFDSPRGVALGAAVTDIFVSDNNNDRVSRVDATTGQVTAYANINTPYGMEWLAGGTSAFADSLMVAAQQSRIVESAKGNVTNAAAYLRNTPIDLTLSSGTMYILTSPSANNRGRIYKVTGF
jgi:sugar lactone lactonase YvrE